MAMVASFQRDEERAEREALDVAGTLRDERRVPIDVIVEDLSSSGFRIRTDAELEVGQAITIGIPALGQCRARVARLTPSGYGCEFVDAINPALVAAPRHAHAVVQVDFGGEFSADMARDWSAKHEPQIDKLALPVRAMLIAGLGAGAWMVALAALRLI